MERQTGWRPLPVVLKILLILLIIGTVVSLFGVFSAHKGYTLLGRNIYGLWAANSMFFVNLLFPIILIVAMIRRFRWAWIFGFLLHLFGIINTLLSINVIDELVRQMMTAFPPEILDTLPDPHRLIYSSAIAGVLLGVAIDAFFMLVFLLKRKYFTAKEPQLPVQSPEV